MKVQNQSQFIRNYSDATREHFNDDLFRRDNEDLVASIEKLLRSCEHDKYYTLKLLSFRAIYDYEEIYDTLRAHEEKRRKKNSKNENSYDYININDTDMILIKVEWFIRHNGVERIEEDGKTVEVTNPEEILEVLIALPRFVKKYYFRLNGNYYTTTFQIVDGSTYNNTGSSHKSNTATMKTIFSPIKIFRSTLDLADIKNSQIIKCTVYNSIIFGNITNAIYYLLANLGFYGFCQWLDIHCVYITQEPNLRPDFYCFQKNGIYISVPKSCFTESIVQAFVATLYEGINKETKYNDLFDIHYWLKNLGTVFKNSTVEKGLFVLDSVDGIYDNITKEDLHLPEEDKKNTYDIIIWLLKEFSNIRLKENFDVRTKKVRISDYIAHVYATKLNNGLIRISDLGRRVTLKKVIQAVYTQPMYILKSISTMSNLVSYRDMVNDNDATVALKYTYKGISGLGENGASIPIQYRYVHPTHVGILDLDASSNSDPGMSGMICPMAPMYGHSFSQYEEPNSWKENWDPVKQAYFGNAAKPVEFEGGEPKLDFFKLREQVTQEELDLNRVVCPISSIDNSTFSYGCSVKQIEQRFAEKSKQQPLFNIVEDPED
jgi:hypothetical protein